MTTTHESLCVDLSQPYIRFRYEFASDDWMNFNVFDGRSARDTFIVNEQLGPKNVIHQPVTVAPPPQDQKVFKKRGPAPPPPVQHQPNNMPGASPRPRPLSASKQMLASVTAPPPRFVPMVPSPTQQISARTTLPTLTLQQSLAAVSLRPASLRVIQPRQKPENNLINKKQLIAGRGGTVESESETEESDHEDFAVDHTPIKPKMRTFLTEANTRQQRQAFKDEKNGGEVIAKPATGVEEGFSIGNALFTSLSRTEASVQAYNESVSRTAAEEEAAYRKLRSKQVTQDDW